MRATLIATLIGCVLLGSSADGAAASRYELGTVKAAGFMREALLRRPNLSFQAGYARRVKCNKRINDIRLKCKMQWVVGDLSFWGHGTIWLTFPGHQPFWNFSYRIIRLNEYCAAVVEGDDCTRVFVAK